jgi:hypothetical protein
MTPGRLWVGCRRASVRVLWSLILPDPADRPRPPDLGLRTQPRTQAASHERAVHISRSRAAIASSHSIGGMVTVILWGRRASPEVLSEAKFVPEA